jgi:large subunit ribosomal protein L20
MRVARGKARRRKHKKVLSATKGYRMTKSKLYRVAHEAYMHAGQYSYAHRRRRHSQMKEIWIKRLNAAAGKEGIKYNDLINKLKLANIEINKKILSEIAVNSPEVFSQIVKSF